MNKSLVIGVAGPSAGGKTTVTEKIKEEFGDSVVVVSFDDYYKNQDHLEFDERVVQNYDHPNAFDVDLLAIQLKELINGNSINRPSYDFTLHTRHSDTVLVEPREIIIIEGLLPLHFEEIRNLLDIKIFVETDADVCFIRRLKRNIRDRGRTQESVIEQYLTTVKPMREAFIDPTKKYADIVFLHGGKNPVVIDLVKHLIMSKLSELN